MRRNEIKNKVIRLRNKKVGYFDNEGVFREVSEEKAISMDFPELAVLEDGRVYLRKWFTYSTPLKDENGRILQMAIAILKEGDTIDDLYNYLKILKPKKHTLPEGLDRFLAKMGRPEFVREPGNHNTKTFDFIHLDVYIVHVWETNKIQYIKDNLPEIKERVIEHLQKYKSFQRYGVPVGFLKITNITLTHDDALHFIFELKKF